MVVGTLVLIDKISETSGNLAFSRITSATFNISGKLKGHGSYLKTLVGPPLRVRLAVAHMKQHAAQALSLA